MDGYIEEFCIMFIFYKLLYYTVLDKVLDKEKRLGMKNMFKKKTKYEDFLGFEQILSNYLT